METIMHYHGLDVLAMSLSVFAVYLLGNQNRLGFLIFIVANLLWIALGFCMMTSYGIALGNLFFLVLNVRGYVNWGVRERRRLRDRFRARFQSTLQLFYYGNPTNH